MSAPKELYYNKQLYESEAHKIHGDKYNYSRTVLEGSTKKIEVICNQCGNHFNVGAWDHLYSRGHGRGCPICANKSRSKTLTRNTKWFMDELKTRRKDRGKYYDYSKVVYIKSTDEIEIGCPIHGMFRQIAWSHLNGKGCPKCAQIKIANTKRYSWNAYYKKMVKSRFDHCKYYDYSKVIYKDSNTDIEIICPKHGSFWQKPKQHKKNCGCPHCKSSLLESEVRGILNKYNVKYECEKRFDWLGLQSIDFFLCDFNIGIECQGIQHYKEVPFFKSTTLEQRQKMDKNKRNLCFAHGIPIYYIRYDEENVEDSLKKILQKCTK